MIQKTFRTMGMLLVLLLGFGQAAHAGGFFFSFGFGGRHPHRLGRFHTGFHSPGYRSFPAHTYYGYHGPRLYAPYRYGYPPYDSYSPYDSYYPYYQRTPVVTYRLSPRHRVFRTPGRYVVKPYSRSPYSGRRYSKGYSAERQGGKKYSDYRPRRYRRAH